MQKLKLSTAAHDVRDRGKPCAIASEGGVEETRAYLGSWRGPKERPWPWKLRLWEAF